MSGFPLPPPHTIRYVDFMLFWYEFSTALLCRVLQLSIPNTNAAILVSLLGAGAEMGVRAFYYISFLKAGMQQDGSWDKEEIVAYALRGKYRVADASNDMIVEYSSSFAAAMFLLEFQGTGAFSFASSAVVAPATIYFLVAIQPIPEIPIDYFITFLEVYGGLAVVHGSHWKSTTGAYKNHPNYFYKFGDLQKSTMLKFPVCIFACAFSMAACVIWVAEILLRGYD